MESNNDRIFTLCLLGETGSGKSSLVNFILGEDKCAAKASLLSVTKSVDINTGIYLTSGIEVRLVDCPGLNDPSLDDQCVNSIVQSIRQIVCVNVFVIVVNGTQCRLTASLKTMLHVFRGSFGIDFFDNGVFVFTHLNPTSMQNDHELCIRMVDLNSAIREEFDTKAWLNVFCVDTVRDEHYEGSVQELLRLWGHVKNYPTYSPLDAESLSMQVQDFRSRVAGLKVMTEDLRRKTDKVRDRIAKRANYLSDTDSLVESIMQFDPDKHLRRPKTLFPEAEEMRKVKQCIVDQQYSFRFNGFLSFIAETAKSLIQSAFDMTTAGGVVGLPAIIRNFVTVLKDVFSKSEIKLVVRSDHTASLTSMY